MSSSSYSATASISSVRAAWAASAMFSGMSVTSHSWPRSSL